MYHNAKTATEHDMERKKTKLYIPRYMEWHDMEYIPSVCHHATV